MKRQRNTTQMKEQTRNTSLNKWRGNRQTTWKSMCYKNSKDDQKSWKQNGENVQESINKDLEELKNKHVETTQLLKLKIL